MTIAKARSAQCLAACLHTTACAPSPASPPAPRAGREAPKSAAALSAPAALRLTFTNVGDKAFRLDAHAMTVHHLRLAVEGPAEKSVIQTSRFVEFGLTAPTEADFPTIQPGASGAYPHPIPFPADIGPVATRILATGAFRVQAIYSSPEGGRTPGGEPAWSGRVASNTVTVRVFEPIEKAAAVQGLRLKLVPRPDKPGEFNLRWENASEGALVTVWRDRCCDLYDRVYLRDAEGRYAFARADNRDRDEHQPPQPVPLQPGKADEEPFDPWHWVAKPEKPGTYTLWVESSRAADAPRIRRETLNDWSGRVWSSAVEITIPAAAPQ